LESSKDFNSNGMNKTNCRLSCLINETIALVKTQVLLHSPKREKKERNLLESRTQLLGNSHGGVEESNKKRR
jgi:hypothetical protein